MEVFTILNIITNTNIFLLFTMDFSYGKELVDIYYIDNNNEDRECVKTEIINGRTYDKYGTNTATTAAALLYKVEGPSNKPCKYALLVGVARQNPGDYVIDAATGREIATENAMINPVIVIEFPTNPGINVIYDIVDTYIESLPVKFVKTKQETLMDIDRRSYIRTKAMNNYYTQYYNDFKHEFFYKFIDKRNGCLCK